MKQTVNVNIGSRAFTLDEDAYQTLRDYFADVRSRLPEGDTETESDLETRMGEILIEQVPSPMYVVSIGVVRSAINRLGTPECFGARHGEATGESDEAERSGPGKCNPSRRVYRSRTERSIAGVCGGLAEYLGADAGMVRLVTLLLILFGGLSIWIYVILWIVLPEEPVRPFAPYAKSAKTNENR